jgi:diguanylate cyclase (GGDEF)-like protein
MVANEQKLRVLVAEDEALSRRMLTMVLESWGYPVDIARDGREAWERLSSPCAPALVLLDWMMPEINGLDICRRLRSDADRPYSYLIVLTANSSTADLVEALDAGADDFIAKPFNHDELRVRLRVGERIVTLQQELHRRGSYDELTNLLNRRTFLESLRRVHDRAARTDTQLGLAMLDVDHFKRINDLHGHQAGDIVLSEVARRLSASVRPTDLTCRYGGEEFVVAMPDCSVPAAAGIGERLRAIVSDTPIALPESSITVSVSVGISVATLTSQTGYDHLLQAADRALYRAKAAGRNRVEIAEPVAVDMSSSRRAS